MRSRRRIPAADGAKPARRFTVPDEPALAPEHVDALREARLTLQFAAREGSDHALIPAIQRYVRAACRANFARLTVRHTVAAVLIAAAAPAGGGHRRLPVDRWMGYVNRLYDVHGPK